MIHVCLDDSPTFRLIELDTVTSTNDFARGFHNDPRALTVITARAQTAGRGQGDHTWTSAPADNLLMSAVFTPPAHILPADSFIISQAVALAVRDAAQSFTTHPIDIKFPNDIYVRGRKLAGILIETEMTGKTINRVIAGIGLNVGQTQWPADVPNPTSLTLEASDTTPADSGTTPAATGNQPTVSDALAQLVGRLRQRLRQLDSDPADNIKNEYLKYLINPERYEIQQNPTQA